MEEAIKQLSERFPLLSRLTVAQTENSSIADALPAFFGLILAVMNTPADQPICFVLPRRGDVARIVVVLQALAKFKQRHQESVKIIAEQKLRPGQLVQIFPSEEVFVYEGIRDGDPDHFWLSELDLFRQQRNGYRTKFPVKMSFPLWAIQRLAPTMKKRPIGSIRERADSLSQPPVAAIDDLLDTVTFGNFLGASNEVLLLDSQSGFMEFSKNVTIQVTPQNPNMPSVKDLLPFGELVQSSVPGGSWLKKWDERNPVGEPLIATTHSAELLANYCLDSATRSGAQSKSKLVVANGLSRFKQRQAYDDIADSQRLVLFASCDEEEMIGVLGQAPTPCKFWWLSAAEINAGRVRALTNNSNGPVNKVMRWANNRERMKVEAVPCENQELESVCLRLEELRNQLSDDESDPLTRLTSHAWRMLNDASALFYRPTTLELQKFSTQINNLRNELKNNVWLKPESVNVLNAIASGIESCLQVGGKLGVSKGAALYRVVRESQTAQLKCALIARNENQLKELEFWLRQRSISLETYSPRTLPDEDSFDRLIYVSWPGWYSLKQVANTLVSPRITVLAYSFEGRWLNQCIGRLQQRPNAPLVSDAEKSELFLKNNVSQPNWVENGKMGMPVVVPVFIDTGTLQFEQRLRAARKGGAGLPTIATETMPARYVSFVGDSYAFLTESHKLAVATALVSGSVRGSQRLPERTVLEVKCGDFIVFPESGDREFLQMVADKRIGPRATSLRELARKWKFALQKSGLTPEQFHEQAKSYNRPRHIGTIRYWFADNSQIGPREKDDLILIALVTADKEFESEIDDVRLAIESLWSAHQSAGMRLRDALLQRLPEVLGQVEENGTQVDLDELGSAWIVQVDAVASHDEQRGRSEVNRLLRDRSSTNSEIFG